MKHKVKIELKYVFGNVPHKWFGTCTVPDCNWFCMSWEWQREDGSGTLAMSNEHFLEHYGSVAE